MTNTTHTPGPWYVYDDGEGLVEVIPGEDLNESPLCTVERPSDAYLIAAAPELLAALDQVDAYLSPFDGEEDAYAEIRSVIQQAIAKAKGE